MPPTFANSAAANRLPDAFATKFRTISRCRVTRPANPVRSSKAWHPAHHSAFCICTIRHAAKNMSMSKQRRFVTIRGRLSILSKPCAWCGRPAAALLHKGWSAARQHSSACWKKYCASPTRTLPSCCSAKLAPAKNWSPTPSTKPAPARPGRLLRSCAYRDQNRAKLQRTGRLRAGCFSRRRRCHEIAVY